MDHFSMLHQGATLLLSAPLLFSKTARFEGKLSVKGSGSLEGPCFWFREDAFIQSSAEMHFADCHNVAKDSYVFGGAICVCGNLTATGNLSIHNCSAKHGGTSGLKYLWPVPSGWWWRVSFSVSGCLRCLCYDWSSGFWSLTCCDNANSLFFVTLMTGDRACLEIQKQRVTIFCFLNNVCVAARDDTIWSTVMLCVGQCCWLFKTSDFNPGVWPLAKDEQDWIGVVILAISALLRM